MWSHRSLVSKIYLDSSQSMISAVHTNIREIGGPSNQAAAAQILFELATKMDEFHDIQDENDNKEFETLAAVYENQEERCSDEFIEEHDQENESNFHQARGQ